MFNLYQESRSEDALEFLLPVRLLYKIVLMEKCHPLNSKKMKNFLI